MSAPAESALPADSKNKTDYQASIISFQAIYLQTGNNPFIHTGNTCNLFTSNNMYSFDR